MRQSHIISQNCNSVAASERKIIGVYRSFDGKNIEVRFMIQARAWKLVAKMP